MLYISWIHQEKRKDRGGVHVATLWPDLIFIRNVPAVGTKALGMTRALKTNLVVCVIPSLMSRGN